MDGSEWRSTDDSIWISLALRWSMKSGQWVSDICDAPGSAVPGGGNHHFSNPFANSRVLSSSPCAGTERKGMRRRHDMHLWRSIQRAFELLLENDAVHEARLDPRSARRRTSCFWPQASPNHQVNFLSRTVGRTTIEVLQDNASTIGSTSWYLNQPQVPLTSLQHGFHRSSFRCWAPE